ncbi:MAG: lipocalin-like domain-containing protein [Gemmatimonadota bacterium]|nr:lipocalin-like domain-containing protein [Gemmatimonadota bacterium]
MARSMIYLSLVAFSLSSLAALRPSAANPELVGSWRLVERAVADSGGTWSHSPAGIFMFSTRHYSLMYVTSPEPRRPFPGDFAAWSPAEHEELEAFRMLVANAGSYELAGSKVRLRPLVAKVPNVMARDVTIEMGFQLEDDELHMSWQLGETSEQLVLERMD